MQSKYSDEIYKIMKINKNNVLLGDGKLFKRLIFYQQISKLNKGELLTNNELVDNIKKVDKKEYKIERKLKQLKQSNIDQDNIINTKRIRKHIIRQFLEY